MSARANPRCQILAFEAQEPMYRFLRKNLKKNEFLSIVEARNVAVGHVCHSRVGIANFVEDLGVRHPDCAYGDSETFKWGCVGRARERLRLWCPCMVSVDSLELPRVDYMKIDVEGFEPLVILGEQETIKRCKTVIMFEFNEKRPLKSVLDHFGLQREAEPLLQFGHSSSTALQPSLVTIGSPR